METFLEILKYCIPALIVCLVVYIMMTKFLKREEMRCHYLFLRSTSKKTLPLRLSAYERMVLFLERISPDSLLPRIQEDSMNSLQLHAALLLSVRAEFEHNVAQQVYLSDEAWDVIKKAKESIIQLINTCAAAVPPQEPSSKLAGVILATYSENADSPTEAAISFLKNEVKSYFS